MEETVKNLEKETIEVRMLRNSLDASLSKAMTIFERTQGNLTTARKVDLNYLLSICLK